MKTIQVVLEPDLPRAANGAAKRARVNRPALIRQALREHLNRLRTREVGARDRRGYREHPKAAGDVGAWERVASWPEQ
ncbi:MAG: CopG family transcriptional regulator [Terriglobia bacterium]